MVIKTCKKCKIKKDYKLFIRKIRGEESIGILCNDCLVEPKNIYNSETSVKASIKYQKKKYKEDSFFRFKHNIRTNIRQAIKRNGYTKNSKTYNILGADFKTVYKYIEDQFTNEMTWDNIHIDHIKPISLAKTEEDVIKLNHYTNLQPLLIIDNLKKSNKYISINE